MDKIIVLGAGLVGKEVAIALSKKYDTSCADIQLCSLEVLSPQHPITVLPCNFKDKKALRELIQPFDLVINAVSSSIGFETLRQVIEEKKNVVNLSFFPEEASRLDEFAKKQNITAVMSQGEVSELPATVVNIAGYLLGEKSSLKGIINMKKELITD
jgi:saccharopine dehydrogenase-like NADP-dependent oxidoreductase